MLVRRVVAAVLVSAAGLAAAAPSAAAADSRPAAHGKGFVGFFATEAECVERHDSYASRGIIVQPTHGCYHADSGYWFHAFMY